MANDAYDSLTQFRASANFIADLKNNKTFIIESTKFMTKRRITPLVGSGIDFSSSMEKSKSSLTYSYYSSDDTLTKCFKLVSLGIIINHSNSNNFL